MIDPVLDTVLKKLRFTFSRYCRSGIVGDLCRCWRCRGVTPKRSSIKEKREAELIDLAFKAGYLRKLAFGKAGPWDK